MLMQAGEQGKDKSCSTRISGLHTHTHDWANRLGNITLQTRDNDWLAATSFELPPGARHVTMGCASTL